MKRLRTKAEALVREERETLLVGLHAELDSERARFEARKPAISEEVRLADLSLGKLNTLYRGTR